MRKGLFLLALIAFTQNVKAETINFSDITAIDGTTPQEWLSRYVITGGEIRVSWASLPNDPLDGLYYYTVRYSNGMTNAWIQGNFSSGQNYSLRSLFRAFYLSYEDYQELGYFPPDGIPALWPSSLFTEETTFTISSMANSINYLQEGTGISATTGRPTKTAVEREAAARNQAMLLEKVVPYQSIPINDLKIDISSGGSCTNCEVLLGAILTNMTTYTDYLLYMATNQTDSANVAYNLNHHDWTIDDKWDVITNLYSQQGLGNAAVQYDYFQRLELLLAALVYKPQNDYSDYLSSITNQLDGLENIDYTDYLKQLITFDNPTNITGLAWLYSQLSKGPTAWGMSYDGFLKRAQQNQLFGGGAYVTAMNSFITDFRDEFYAQNASISAAILSVLLRDLLWTQGVDWSRWQQTTNIISGIDLGRDWLTLATNDTSSLPYWLNQQDYSTTPPIGVTNFEVKTRWSVLTNQYSQIALNGQAANGTDQWNYFKRMEMLLAALVYKPDDEGEKLSNDMNSQSSDAETKKEDVKNSLDGLLSSFGGQKTLLQDQTSSFLSALGRVNEMFDQTWTPGQWRYWKDGAEDGGSSSTGGASGSKVELWIDFSDSKYQFIFDFIRSLCGFVWSFFSLLIIYRFAIFAYKLGMKFARVSYSILRHMFGQ